MLTDPQAPIGSGQEEARLDPIEPEIIPEGDLGVFFRYRQAWMV